MIITEGITIIIIIRPVAKESMVLNATKGTMLKNCVHLYNSLPKPFHRSQVQTEQQHRFDGGIMQLTEPGGLRFSCFHWKASQQRKTRLHVKWSRNNVQP